MPAAHKGGNDKEAFDFSKASLLLTFSDNYDIIETEDINQNLTLNMGERIVEKINCNKIINQAAKEILKPEGLFQKGSSRTWIDDNGWYLIIVDYQPSGFAKGSHLDVAINFLWKKKDYISFDYGDRENKFVTFDGNEQKFYDEMIKLAEKALIKVKEYRRFSDLNFAKESILRIKKDDYLTDYNKMMICGLTCDKKAKNYFDKFLNKTESIDFEYIYDYRSELNNLILPVIDDTQKFREYIISKITDQRLFWMSKSSMKKMKTDKKLF